MDITSPVSDYIKNSLYKYYMPLNPQVLANTVSVVHGGYALLDDPDEISFTGRILPSPWVVSKITLNARKNGAGAPGVLYCGWEAAELGEAYDQYGGTTFVVPSSPGTADAIFDIDLTSIPSITWQDGYITWYFYYLVGTAEANIYVRGMTIEYIFNA